MVSWIRTTSPGQSEFDQVFGLLPATYEAYREFVGSVWTSGAVDAHMLELCRLRVAQVLGCDSELAVRYRVVDQAGLDEAKVAALTAYEGSPLFSDAEQACLGYAELFVADPHAITDQDAEAVRSSLGSEGLAVLTIALAIFDGFSRFRTFLGVSADGGEVVLSPEGAPASLP